MALFFFDVLDGERVTLDDRGLDFADLGAARQEAQRAIGELLKDAMPDGDQAVMVIRIRDGGGRALLMVSAVMTVSDAQPG